MRLAYYDRRGAGSGSAGNGNRSWRGAMRLPGVLECWQIDAKPLRPSPFEALPAWPSRPWAEAVAFALFRSGIFKLEQSQYPQPKKGRMPHVESWEQEWESRGQLRQPLRAENRSQVL